MQRLEFFLIPISGTSGINGINGNMINFVLVQSGSLFTNSHIRGILDWTITKLNLVGRWKLSGFGSTKQWANACCSGV